MRLSTLPTAFGEKMVMRIFDPDTAVKDLDALGFARTTRRRWEAAGDAPARHHPGDRADRLGQDDHALLDAQAALATEEVNVCTIEDPIEMIEPALQPDAGADRSSTSASPKACAR